MRCLPRLLLVDNNENLRKESAFFTVLTRDFLQSAFFFFKIIETQHRETSAKESGKRNHRDQESCCSDMPTHISNGRRFYK